MFQEVIHKKDIQDIATLAKEIWMEHYSKTIPEQQVAYMVDLLQSEAVIAKEIQSENYIYYKVLDNQRLMGYLALQTKEEQVFLSKLYLLESARGLGLGKKAVQFTEDMAKKASVSVISLTVNKKNKGSIAFYEKMGFKAVDSILFDLGENFFMDDLVMEKSL